MEKIRNRRLHYKYENALSAYKALEKSIRVLRKSSHDYETDEYAVIIAGVVKHFELSLETTWNFLQIAIRAKHGLILKKPREVIQECFFRKMLPQDTTDGLLLLLDYRNNTVHVYNQLQADEFCQEIEDHFKAIGRVFKLLTPDKL